MSRTKQMGSAVMKNILQLDYKEARKFLLENKSYVNFDLPEYFNFAPVLEAVSSKLGNYDVNYFFAKNGSKKIDPRDLYDVNHRIFSNKDGQLAWRPFELMHPVLYVALVHILTKEENWKFVVKRFKDLSTGQIEVASIPALCSKKKSAKAEQIRAWWENFEQNCVAQGLNFQYVFETDVADCYSSIYTHAITWALYGKDEAYENRDVGSFGKKVDQIFQMMHHRQTNGIPQGSVLSDFIAELLFAYADSLLIKAIDAMDGIEKTDYKIIRYRDDYRIFTNRTDVGSRILKELTEILEEFGLKLNSQKTKRSDDIVLSSIKTDKIDELFVPNIKKERDNFAKWLIQIYAVTLKHPNTGKTSRQLGAFHQELIEHLDGGQHLRNYEKPEVMLSVVVSIAMKNPRYYNMAMAVSSLLVRAADKSRRGLLVEKLLNKFSQTPNTGLLDVWAQRVSYPIDPTLPFTETLTSVVSEEYTDNSVIWNIEWLKPAMGDIIKSTKLVDIAVLASLREQEKIAISREEVDLFIDIPS